MKGLVPEKSRGQSLAAYLLSRLSVGRSSHQRGTDFLRQAKKERLVLSDALSFARADCSCQCKHTRSGQSSAKHCCRMIAHRRNGAIGVRVAAVSLRSARARGVVAWGARVGFAGIGIARIVLGHLFELGFVDNVFCRVGDFLVPRIEHVVVLVVRRFRRSGCRDLVCFRADLVPFFAVDSYYIPLLPSITSDCCRLDYYVSFLSKMV